MKTDSIEKLRRLVPAACLAGIIALGAAPAVNAADEDAEEKKPERRAERGDRDTDRPRGDRDTDRPRGDRPGGDRPGGDRGRGSRDPAAMLNRLAEQLKLSDEQKTAVGKILKESGDKRRAIFEKARPEGGGRPDREAFAKIREQMQGVQKETETALAKVLSEEQMAQYKEFSQRRGRGRGGPGGDRARPDRPGGDRGGDRPSRPDRPRRPGGNSDTDA